MAPDENIRPIGFLSYVRKDDEHDGDGISQLKLRLEDEICLQTDKNFDIFQDRDGIGWGKSSGKALILLLMPRHFYSL
jgi:hypothetical protein